MRDSSRAADSAAAEATDNQFAAICKIKAVAKPSSKVSNSLFFCLCWEGSCAAIRSLRSIPFNSVLKAGGLSRAGSERAWRVQNR